MWKIQDFSAAQILREINFGHFDAQKTAILTIWATMNLESVGILIFSSVRFFINSKYAKFKAFEIVKTAVFDLLKSAKIDFTQN